MRHKQRFIRWSAVLAAAAWLIPATVSAEFARTGWQYAKPIDLSQLQQEQLARVELDAELFTGASSGLRDLRIVTGGGAEVPYQVEVVRDERTRLPVRGDVRDIGYAIGDYNTLTVDVGEAPVLHNEVRFDTASTNFRRTALVDVSNDAQTWTRVAASTVYDFSVPERRFQTRETSVRYPESSARYVRLRVLDDGQGALSIGGAEVAVVRERAAGEVSWPVSSVDVGQDTVRKATLVTLDFGVAGLPTQRVELAVAPGSFHRATRVETSDDGSMWRLWSVTPDIYRYDTPKFQGERLTVTFSETTSRYLRVVIVDEDSPPLAIGGATAWGLRRTAFFVAQPGETYAAYYGNPDAARPSYDLARLLPFMETGSAITASLGPQTLNDAFTPKRPPAPPVSERFPWLVPVAVAIAAAVVGALLVGVIRRARSVLPPPGD